MDADDRLALVNITKCDAIAHALKDKILKCSSGPAALILSQASCLPYLDKWLPEISKYSIQPSVRAKAYRYQLENKVTWVSGRKWEWTNLKWGKRKLVPILNERTTTIPFQFHDALKSALSDRSPHVRYIAGEFLIRDLDVAGPDIRALIEQLASDKIPYVSERGIFALKKLSTKDSLTSAT